MTVTAKLAHQFYQQFGETTATELVEWLNTMDATAQARLEKLNEMNFARFAAEMKAGFAEIHAHLAERDVQYERRFGELRTDIARVEARLAWQLMGTFATLIGVLLALGAQFLRR